MLNFSPVNISCSVSALHLSALNSNLLERCLPCSNCSGAIKSLLFVDMVNLSWNRCLNAEDNKSRLLLFLHYFSCLLLQEEFVVAKTKQYKILPQHHLTCTCFVSIKKSLVTQQKDLHLQLYLVPLRSKAEEAPVRQDRQKDMAD